MFSKRRPRFLLGISTVGCGIFGVILWIQLDRGKELAATAMPSSTLQVSPKLRKSIELPLTKTIEVSQEEKQTVDNQSKDFESVPTVSDVPDTAVPLDEEEETLSALVDSLSVEDLEELEGLTLRDFLSDEEKNQLDRRVFGYLNEFKEIAPRIVDLRQKYSDLFAHSRKLIKNKPLENPEYHKLVDEMDAIREELRSLERRLPELMGTLLDEELEELGYRLDQEKIRRIEKEIIDGKGFHWYKPQVWREVRIE